MARIAAVFAPRGVAYRLVYVTEAHPVDGWMPIYAPREFTEVRYAKTLEERLAVARKFVGVYEIDPDTVIIDGLADDLERGFEARPERIAVVGGGRLLWRCELGSRSLAAFPDEEPPGLVAFLESHV